MTKNEAVNMLVEIVAEAIQGLGEVPSGQLYAHLMGVIDIHTYNGVIATLKKQGKITESGYLLKWVK